MYAHTLTVSSVSYSIQGREQEAREAKKGLWADPQPVPPWEWRKRKEREWPGLFLGVGALGFCLRRSQRNMDCRGKIKYFSLILTRFVVETGRVR
jgi:hypothetical protein